RFAPLRTGVRVEPRRSHARSPDSDRVDAELELSHVELRAARGPACRAGDARLEVDHVERTRQHADALGLAALDLLIPRGLRGGHVERRPLRLRVVPLAPRPEL